MALRFYRSFFFFEGKLAESLWTLSATYLGETRIAFKDRNLSGCRQRGKSQRNSRLTNTWLGPNAPSAIYPSKPLSCAQENSEECIHAAAMRCPTYPHPCGFESTAHNPERAGVQMHEKAVVASSNFARNACIFFQQATGKSLNNYI